ncbi:agouti signaling protein 1 isoform X4 [Poecilia reticulata]|uniref:agouti signaling protein 1 isoform X4 n=1 Tax=Poecilia reticulata TaxID=8081 RepID=UPI0007EA1676|nr:PREDICTED: agouti-signaling protein isoform X4 [Poecilia reticulata]
MQCFLQVVPDESGSPSHVIKRILTCWSGGSLRRRSQVSSDLTAVWLLLEAEMTRTMQAFLLLGCCVLALTQCCLGSAHMIPDDRLSTNRVAASSTLSHSLQIDPPPVVIS